jgi:hypothetical protein
MNTTKSVYNKLFKEEATELASHEVHLNSIDDFKKAVQNVMNLNGNAYNKSKTAKPILEQALKEYNMVKPSIDRALNVGLNIMDQATKLGLQLPSEFNSSRERLLDEEKKLKEGISKVEGLIKGLNF